MTPMPRLVGCILTKDEEAAVGEAVRSLRAAADIVLVVDSLSQDQTREVAVAAGAVVLERPFDDFATQRNWALDQIETRFAPVWVFSLDADERVTPGLAEELRVVAASNECGFDAFTVVRHVRFCGRILRHGGMASTRLVRMMRPSAGRYEQRSVNEHFVVAPGLRIGALRRPLLHEDVASWDHYIDKHNRYSALEARARLARSEGAVGVTPRQALSQRSLRRRWLRERLWERLPAKPVLRFIQSYVLQAGFLDGQSGLNKAVFNAWLEMCIDLKYLELARRRRENTAKGCMPPRGTRPRNS